MVGIAVIKAATVCSDDRPAQSSNNINPNDIQG